MAFYTYIAACKSNTAIYIGVTSDLQDCMHAHALGLGGTHTSRYRIRKLVYFERYEALPEAIMRAGKLKRWRRAWKNDLINSSNPKWSDLMMEVSFL